PVALPPVDVVSATTVPTPANQIASSVTVITAADLARDQRRTLPEALATVPGLNIVQAGGPGAQTSVFLRGTNSNHVKVLIDGIDVTDPSNPQQTFDFAHMLTGDIERIEVLRGPQSGLYGADAIGGVISITTKTGQGPPKTYAQVEGGSFGTFNQSAGVSGSQDRFNYRFDVQHWRSTSTPVTPLELLSPGQVRNNDIYDNKTFSTRMGYDFSDAFGVNVVSRYTRAKLGFTGDFNDNFGPDFEQSEQLTHQSYSRGEAVWSLFDGRFKNYFGVAYTNSQNQNTFPQDPNVNGIPPGSGPSKNEGTRTKVDWRGVAAVADGQTLVFGLEDEMFGLIQSSPFGGVPVASNANKAAYVELQSQFAERFFLVSNIRRDDNDAFGGHQTFRLAPAVITPWSETKLKASYGTGAVGAPCGFSPDLLRQPQPAPGGKQGLGRRVRAAAGARSRPLRRDLVSQRHHQSDRGRSTSGPVRVRHSGPDPGQYRSGADIRCRDVCDLRRDRPAQAARRVHLHQGGRRRHRPRTAPAAPSQGECHRGLDPDRSAHAVRDGAPRQPMGRHSARRFHHSATHGARLHGGQSRGELRGHRAGGRLRPHRQSFRHSLPGSQRLLAA